MTERLRHQYMATHGIVSIALDFRSGNTDPYPASVQDINYAVRWAKLNARDLSTRPDLVGLSGQSSGGHLAMLVAMHFLTRGAFTVAFEWRRLAQATIVMGGLAVAGDLLLPTGGAGGLLSRAAVFVAIPAALYMTGFAHRSEIEHARVLLRKLVS